MAQQEVQRVWKCGNCTVHNDEKHTTCPVCFDYQRSTDDILFYADTSSYVQHVPHKWGSVTFLPSDVIIQQIPDAYNAYRTNGSITKIFVFGKHEVNV
eukprot:977694_1